MQISIKILDKRAKVPEIATNGSAGFDLKILLDEPFVLKPNQSFLFNTGIAIHINNPNYAGLILPRSGLGSRGIVLGNLVGLIDSDYQGEIRVNLWNRGDQDYQLINGERVAQLIITPIILPEFVEVEQFADSTDRGEFGFGHTGLK